MKVYCCDCQTFCGDIRDAKLRKNLRFICDRCHSSRESVDVPDFLKGFIGSGKNRRS